MKSNVIFAIVRRELGSYFSSPTGYVFITIFIFLSAFAAFWLPDFFDRNLANLDQLNEWFPALLLFLIPAITMGSWAEERKQGTEELLLTLPARDSDLVVGKYLACLAIYTVALLFSVSHVAVLAYLGRPDLGLMASTYFGYWLCGVGLIAVGMAASALTSNLTVAFILGAVLSGIVIGIGKLGMLMPDTALAQFAKALSLPDRFEDFGRGVISAENVLYFVMLAVMGLLANGFLIGRRHWAGSPSEPQRLALGFVRAAAFVVAAGSIVILGSRASARADATAERLWSLSPQTMEVVKAIDPERPVQVTAYVSREAPASYTQTKETLLGLLRELDVAQGGKRIAVRIVETEPYSDEAREAKKTFGIDSRAVAPSPEDRDMNTKQVFMGVAFTNGPRQFVIPFMSRGLPVEYELARSIRAVSAAGRKKVGVLETDAKLFGEFDMQTFSPREDWPIVSELRKQYEVVRVARGQPVPPDVDVLLVAQASSLMPDEFKHVMDYVRAGRPAAIFEDPLPLVNPNIGTSEPRDAGRNPFQRQAPDTRPKADMSQLYALLGVEEKPDVIVRDRYNPRPQMPFEPEIVFVNAGSGGPEPFNLTDPITSGLQEVVLLATGAINRSADAATKLPNVTYTPLMRTSRATQTIKVNDVLQKDFLGTIRGFNSKRQGKDAEPGQVVAARISGALPAEPPNASRAEDQSAPKPGSVNVVLVADLDLISPEFFQLREAGAKEFVLDNVPFVLNAIDVLAGEQSLLDLRKHRPAHRTLTKLDEARRAEQEETERAVTEANRRADEEIARAKAVLTKKVEEIEKREDLDDTGKGILLESVQSAEQRRVDAQAAAIGDRQSEEIADAKARSAKDIGSLQMRIRTAAVLLPPIPAFLLGCVVFTNRRAGEKAGVVKERLR
ncbi:MAG TPA: Gldg family protein [Phycisphaerales bacterium]|nr:Gldg family protein [Phycisphaerales bacterium]